MKILRSKFFRGGFQSNMIKFSYLRCPLYSQILSRIISSPLFQKSTAASLATLTHLLDVLTVIKHLVMERPFTVVEIVCHHHRKLIKLLEICRFCPLEEYDEERAIMVKHVLEFFVEIFRYELSDKMVIESPNMPSGQLPEYKLVF